MDNYDPKELIRRAFEAAAESGKDSRTMSIAVLKNRMLDLSGGTFSELSLGASTFAEFLNGLPDLVGVDRSTFPARVKLLAPSTGVAQPHGVEAEVRQFAAYVRPDLWRAILDYSSGHQYVWDQTAGVAREAIGDDSCPVLPTITEEELKEWKRDFVAASAGEVTPTVLGRLNMWHEANLATRVLPQRLRASWNHALKEHVAGRLNQWAEERELALAPTTEGDTEYQTNLKALRKLIVECVEVMTREELESVHLPSEAVLRREEGRER